MKTNLLSIIILLSLIFIVGCEKDSFEPTQSENFDTQISIRNSYYTDNLSDIWIELDEETISGTITFEGTGHAQSIFPMEGIFSLQFVGNWLSYTHGPYINNPSPPNVAMWWGIAGSADILLTEPVSKFGLYYASVVPISLRALDSEGQTISIVTGEANYNGGDYLDEWTYKEMLKENNDIQTGRVVGLAYGTYIDNVKITRKVPGYNVVQIITNSTDLNQNTPNVYLGAQSLNVDILGNVSIDVNQIDLSTVRLRDPVSDQAAAPVDAVISDLNGDEYDDITLTFNTSDLTAIPEDGSRPALSLETLQLYLSGKTLEGAQGLGEAIEKLQEKYQELLDKNGKGAEKLSDVIDNLETIAGGLLFHGVQDVEVSSLAGTE